MKPPSVSVCLPAYNEQATIGDVLDEVHDLLAASDLDYEIIVCNDGSRDGTGAIAEERVGRVERLRVLHHPRNRGIQATFEHLYAESTKDFIFLNSTDGQWKTRILLEMLPLTTAFDIIVASRIEKHYTRGRRLVSWGFNAIPRLLFGVRTYDAGAVKLVRREIVQRFPLVSRSPFSEAERLIRAARAGYRIIEYPVAVSVRRSGRASGADPRLVIQAIADVARVWRALRAEVPVSSR